MNDKSVNGVLGSQTRGSRMEGADESTELWQHPIVNISLIWSAQFANKTRATFKRLLWHYLGQMMVLTVGGRITVRLVSSLTRLNLTKEENNMLLFVSSEAVESKLVKLETCQTVILPPPPTVRVLCLRWQCCYVPNPIEYCGYQTLRMLQIPSASSAKILPTT